MKKVEASFSHYTKHRHAWNFPFGSRSIRVYQFDADRRLLGGLLQLRGERIQHARVRSMQRPYARLNHSRLILDQLILPHPAGGTEFQKDVQ